MQPKTKIQIRVDKLSSRLHKLSAAQKCWADDNVFKHYYYRTQKKNTCLECGYSWDVNDRIPLDKLLSETCPHCKTILIVLPGRKRTTRDIKYFYTASVLEEFQLLRYYHISRLCKVGLREKVFIIEVCQHWIRRDGRRVVRAILHNPNSFFLDIGWYRGMGIRANKDNYYYNGKMYPLKKYLPEIRRNGFKTGTHGLNPAFFFSEILSNSRAETLLKNKQYNLLYELGSWNGETKIKKAWPSIRICIRNNYIVKDTTLWLDHLELLAYFHKDLNNSFYICPENLTIEHDKLIRRKSRVEAKKAREQQRSEIIKANVQFKKDKSRYFDIRFAENGLSIIVLDDINEYLQEGESLHHCVFINRYYEEKDSLILSARKGNERIGSIEFSLKTMSVIQIRGDHNTVPAEADSIRKLIEDNVSIFKRAKNAPKNPEIRLRREMMERIAV